MDSSTRRDKVVGLAAQVRQGLGRVRLPSRVRRHAAPAALAFLGLAALLVGLWTQQSPRGADTWGHLYRAQYLAEQMRLHGLGAWATAAWMPDWYLGDPFRTYYPPLTTLLLGPVHYLMGDALQTFRVSAGLALVAFALLTYLALSDLFGPWPAGLGTVMALWAPYQVRTLWFEGNFPRLLALVALPPLVWLTERLLAIPRHRGRTLALLGLAWGWTILAHPQQAYMFAIVLALYLICRLFLEPSIPATSALWSLGGVILGALVVAPWLLPAYSGAEIPDVPFLPAEKIETFVAGLGSLVPSLQMSDGRILFGLGAILLALLAMAARPDPRRSALTLAGIAGLWLSTGDRGVAFNLLPLHSQLLPERFINASSFLLIASASGLLPLRRGKSLPQAAIVVGLVLMDALPGLSLLTPAPFPEAQAMLSTLSAGPRSTTGRVALFTYPEPTSPEVFFAGQSADLLQGWAMENTPHHIALRRVLGAPAWGEAYLGARLSLWDVRTVVVGGGQDSAPAQRALTRLGFTLDQTLGPYTVWRDPNPSGRLQRLPGGQMLILGEQLTSLLAVFPFAEEIRTERASQLALDDLMNRPLIALYRFESDPGSLEQVEAWLEPYLDRGGQAIIDLSGMEDVIGRTVNFLGVQAIRLSVSGTIPIAWDASLGGLPAELSFGGLPETGWSGATYSGLDAVLGEVEWDRVQYPVLGYRQVGRGRAWFVGMNLFYYAQLAGGPAWAATLRDILLDGRPVPTDLRFDAVPVTDYTETAWAVTFHCDSNDSGPVVLSYTYSPRWEVRIDGQAVPFESYEGLIEFDLPAGRHSVEVGYRPYGTVWPRLGLLIGMLGAVSVIALVALDRRFPSPAVEAKPEAPEAIVTYSPCANCGFRLAETRPPTAITYPFNAVSCPICGLVMDDGGFRPGDRLATDARARALDRWLTDHDYDPGIVHGRWGFSVDDFFAAESERAPRPPEDAPREGHEQQDPGRG